MSGRPMAPVMVRGAMIAVMLAAVAGCENPPKNGGGPVAAAAPDPPPYAELAKTQNDRLALLDQFYSRGVVELRWTDEKGREHNEGQVNVDLWVQLPRRTAVRMEKLGDVLLWLGSDDDRVWLFDLMSDETALHLGGHGEAGALEQATALAVEPLAFLDLMGLTPLPDGEPIPIEYDRGLDAWHVTADGRGGRVRIFFDRSDLLPVRVETLDANGSSRVVSTIGRYVRVTQRGMSVLAFPKLGELVRVMDLAHGSEIKVALDGPERGYGQPFARVFDLDRLRRAMATDRVVFSGLE